MERHGHPYTWERGSGTTSWTEVRLDGALASLSWLDNFLIAKLFNLHASSPDHCLIFLDPIIRNIFNGVKHFRFENTWLREPYCLQVVRDCWHEYSTLPIQSKISKCGDILVAWVIKEITGNFKQQIAACKNSIRHLKGKNDHVSVDAHRNAEKELFELLTKKEVFWRQRSKQLWLKEWDRNSKYFYASASARKRQNMIHKLQDENGVGLIGGREMNVDLLAPVSTEEVRTTLFQMHPDKSPGPDASIPEDLNNTNLVLIPKKKNLENMGDLRPIALCNAVYKIISKVMANRLKMGAVDYGLSCIGPLLDHIGWEFFGAHYPFSWHSSSYLYYRALEAKAERIMSLLEKFEEASATHFPRGSFMSAELANNPSYVRRSILEAKDLIIKGGRLLVGSGEDISITRDLWLPDIENPFITSFHPSLCDKEVKCLTTMDGKNWDIEIISNLFNDRDKDPILSIPISSSNSVDTWYWSKETSGKCNREAESTAHCIVGCTFAGLCNESIDNLSFGDWFQNHFQLWSSHKKQLGAMLCWAIWQDINNKVWNGEGDEQWCAPCVDYDKINVDAATFRDKHKFGFGWVLRDARGFVIQVRTGSWQGCVDPGFAEALGVKEALSWIKNSNVFIVTVETDSLVTVQALQSSVIMASLFSSCIEDCKCLHSDLNNVNFCFVKQSANCVTHVFARASWLHSDRSYSFTSIPSSIFDVIVQEML
uniref:RNase H type-1 domain-containing protein n=1 Tax=Cannabis sativa TaxID=3483 RepID=A0A803QI10_CANSA